jgi:hypothetical protein
VSVQRYDAASLGRVTRTPQGFLRAPARLTRTGVLTYRRADGTVVRELRRPEQVFRAESLASLADAPITDLHPREMVTPKNARTLSVGHVSGASARADGRYVEAEVVVTDATMIAAVENGSRREVSCGYSCSIKPGAGVYQGERYDCEQVDIIYNHAGLGPPQWGRAGSDVALRLDGEQGALELGAEDACVIDAAEAPELATPPPKEKGKPMELVTIRIDSLDVQVPPAAAQIINRSVEQSTGRLTEQSTKLAELQRRVDSLQGELDAAKAAATEAADPKRFNAAVAARLSLLERVRPVLREQKLDGLTDRAIKELALKQLHKDLELADKADAYVDARFDGALEALAARSDKREPGEGGSSLEGARRAGTIRSDGEDQPRPRALSWRTPLRVNSRSS